MRRRTKLVCTIGPASSSSQKIEKLIRAGMNVARLNFAHGSLEEHSRVIKAVRDVSASMDMPVAVLMDLPGPKLRTGKLKKEVVLGANDDFSLIRESILGDECKVSVGLPAFFKDIRVGDTVFLNDGAIQLEVKSIANGEVRCKVIVGGLLTANRGINVPGVKLNVSSVTKSDLEHLAFGVKHGVDFVAASFVRSADDMLSIKKFLKEMGVNIPLIAKIEKHEAVDDIDSILAEADGIMVARGDLGVEIPLEKVPTVQKKIIRKCNQAGKPVIVATQMLESMIGATRPTRAEVSDVANAIFDGADAVMLSGETAIGKYPVRTVKMMAKIIIEAEKVLPYARILLEKSEQVIAQTDDAISYAACHISQQLGAACIVAYTTSGGTALRVSRYRPKVPILAITANAGITRRLSLSWGIEPHLSSKPVNSDTLFKDAAQLAFDTGVARGGDLVVITAGIPISRRGSTNVVKVHQIG